MFALVFLIVDDVILSSRMAYLLDVEPELLDLLGQVAGDALGAHALLFLCSLLFLLLFLEIPHYHSRNLSKS